MFCFCFLVYNCPKRLVVVYSDQITRRQDFWNTTAKPGNSGSVLPSLPSPSLFPPPKPSSQSEPCLQPPLASRCTKPFPQPHLLPHFTRGDPLHLPPMSPPSLHPLSRMLSLYLPQKHLTTNSSFLPPLPPPTNTAIKLKRTLAEQ